MGSAAAGFMFGQMFAGQTQAKPALFHFVALRFSRDTVITPILKEVIKYVFLQPATSSNADLDVEFTDKFELKVLNKSNWRNSTLLTFPMCYVYSENVDLFFCIALRNEIGSPIAMNIALLRNFLFSCDNKKIKYEIW